MPLSRLYDTHPCPDVRLGVRVDGFEYAGHAVTAVRLADGTVLPADAIRVGERTTTLYVGGFPTSWRMRTPASPGSTG